jgi:LCP family protein required for cell wall assembly
VLLALGLLLVFLIVWTVLGFLSVRKGAQEANARLGPRAEAALEPQDGLLLSHPSVILLLGTDHAAYQRARKGFRRSDSIMLIRTDPGRGRIGYLTIPRDLRVEVPGYGFEKINSAMQIGGPALAIRTIRQIVPEVNHVVIVNFDAFKEVIDEVGGVTIDVPGPILSNKFDCPYPTQERCDRWAGWRFAKGKQEMDGRRALIYSRIRENRLNPAESDITRGRRQQDVIQALLGEMASFHVFLKLPFIGDDLMRPLTTDLSAGQFMQLALVQKRSNREVRCRLGGTPQNFGGGSFIQLDEEARRTILAFRGQSAPQPPLPGSTFGSGCR